MKLFDVFVDMDFSPKLGKLPRTCSFTVAKNIQKKLKVKSKVECFWLFIILGVHFNTGHGGLAQGNGRSG